MHHFGSVSVRDCDGFFNMAFRVLWQWAHPAAGQDPETKVFVTAVNDGGCIEMVVLSKWEWPCLERFSAGRNAGVTHSDAYQLA